MAPEFTYRFAEFVDDEPTGTFVEATAPSLVAAVIDVAGIEMLRDDDSVVLADYDFAPSEYAVHFDNISYRLVYGPRTVYAPCFAEVDPESAEPFHCHRVAGHDGPHADWSPEECLVEGCDCTAEEIDSADCNRCYSPIEFHDGAWRCMNVLCREFDKPL